MLIIGKKLLGNTRHEAYRLNFLTRGKSLSHRWLLTTSTHRPHPISKTNYIQTKMPSTGASGWRPGFFLSLGGGGRGSADTHPRESGVPSGGKGGGSRGIKKRSNGQNRKISVISQKFTTSRPGTVRQGSRPPDPRPPQRSPEATSTDGDRC